MERKNRKKNDLKVVVFTTNKKQDGYITLYKDESNNIISSVVNSVRAEDSVLSTPLTRKKMSEEKACRYRRTILEQIGLCFAVFPHRGASFQAMH